MEKELRAIGLNLKTLEVNEERALQRESSFSDHVRCLQNRIKEASGHLKLSTFHSFHSSFMAFFSCHLFMDVVVFVISALVIV